MSYDYREKKIVAVLASNLEVGIAFNVLGHIAVSIGAYIDKGELMGKKELVDASGIKHIGISKYPFIITKIKSSKLKKLIKTIKTDYKDVFIADYPEEMLKTAHDKELIEKISQKSNEDFNYLGCVLYGNSDTINSLTGRFSLWR